MDQLDLPSYRRTVFLAITSKGRTNQMNRFPLLLVMLLAPAAFAAPFLVADVSDARADQCLYTRSPNPTVTSAVVVDTVNGLPANGNRICKVDLAAEPNSATITLALRQLSSGLTSPTVTYTYTKPVVPLPAPQNLRVVP
jgi:hypothetical protein